MGRVHGRGAGEAEGPQPQKAGVLDVALLMGADHGAGARGRVRHSRRVTALAEGIPPVTTGGIPSECVEVSCVKPHRDRGVGVDATNGPSFLADVLK